MRVRLGRCLLTPIKVSGLVACLQSRPEAGAPWVAPAFWAFSFRGFERLCFPCAIDCHRSRAIARNDRFSRHFEPGLERATTRNHPRHWTRRQHDRYTVCFHSGKWIERGDCARECCVFTPRASRTGKRSWLLFQGYPRLCRSAWISSTTSC